MFALTRKLGRDLLRSAGVLATVVAIIAVGTGSFIGMRIAQRTLETSQSAYYRQYRFADFWIDVKKAPLSAVEAIADLPGVATIETRVVFDVILDLPDMTQPIGGRLVSVPTHGFEKTLNGICLVQGSGFSDTRDEEVIVSEEFAVKHGLVPGDSIQLILNRKRETFRIVGTAISPEYVYMVRGEGDFLPDPLHFGILYVKEHYARDVLDFKDACNQIIGRLVPGSVQDIDVLLARMDRMLDPYGVLAVTPRGRQASHRFLSDEIRGLAISAAVMPSIFLVVAALVLNVLMNRLAERQRTIIGTLKAIGYSDRKVLAHFLSFGLVVGILGGVAGGLLGVVFADMLIDVYRDFYHFPAFYMQLDPDLFAIGTGFSVFFAVGGTAKGVWKVLKLHPAEAMRPRPPQRGAAVFLERFPALWNRLGFRTHIALRSLARNRARTITGVIASMCASAIILSTLAMYDSLWYLVDFQFEQIAHSDVDVGMRDERSTAALLEGRDLPGVDRAEPVLSLRCDLRNGRHARRLGITGLAKNHRLTTPMQAGGAPIDIPDQGLVFSRKLAEILHVGAGGRIALTPVRGRRDTVIVPVTSIVDGYLGLECYADLDYLSRIVGEAQAVNSVQLAVSPTRLGDLYRTIKTLPNAQGLNIRHNAKANIEDTFVKTVGLSLGLMIVFAGVIAFGSTLNFSLIEIGDHVRDIAGFRVLGYRPGQIAGIFFRQNLVIFLVGLLLSLPVGYGIVLGTAKAYNTELFRMPVIVRPITVVITALLSSLFVLAAQLVVLRQIRKLDWLEGVKVKE